MSIPILAPSATEQGGTVACLDFQSVAGLIDAVAESDPVRLPILLAMVWETSFKEASRSVLKAAVACRDPLSSLGTICRDALRTLADLEKLARSKHWQSIIHVVGHQDPRACALLNACDYEVARATGRKQARHRVIRARLEAAAKAERAVRSDEIHTYAVMRQARCPGIWQLYEKWCDTK